MANRCVQEEQEGLDGRTGGRADGRTDEQKE